jgi:hypothetical protein
MSSPSPVPSESVDPLAAGESLIGTDMAQQLKALHSRQANRGRFTASGTAPGITAPMRPWSAASTGSTIRPGTPGQGGTISVLPLSRSQSGLPSPEAQPVPSSSTGVLSSTISAHRPYPAAAQHARPQSAMVRPYMRQSGSARPQSAAVVMQTQQQQQQPSMSWVPTDAAGAAAAMRSASSLFRPGTPPRDIAATAAATAARAIIHNVAAGTPPLSPHSPRGSRPVTPERLLPAAGPESGAGTISQVSWSQGVVDHHSTDGEAQGDMQQAGQQGAHAGPEEGAPRQQGDAFSAHAESTSKLHGSRLYTHGEEPIRVGTCHGQEVRSMP